MHIFKKIVVISLVCLGTGCSSLSSLNPFSSKSTPRNPPVALVELKPTMTVRTLWNVAVGSAGNHAFSPALATDAVYAAAGDGAITKIDAASGRVQWKINAGVKLTAGVGTDGSVVAVSGEKGTVYAFDASGKFLWKAQSSSEVLSAPAVGQGLVIVRSQDNRIAAYDAESGTKKWVVQRTAPTLTLRAAPGILISSPNAYVALPGGKLLAISVATGAPRWEASVGDPRGTTELERIIDTSGMPVVTGREVCAVSYQGRAMCFDANSGTLAWAKDLSSEVGLAADERFVFAADVSGAVSALTRDSGASVWKNNKLTYRRLTAPVSFGRAVAVGDYQGYIHFLGREDGALLARSGTDGSEIIAAPLVSGSMLIVQTHAGLVQAIAAE